MVELISFPCGGAYPEQQLPQPVEVTLSENNFGKRNLGCPLAVYGSIGNYVYCGAAITSEMTRQKLEEQGGLRFCPHKHPL
jgi:hypothetical protein